MAILLFKLKWQLYLLGWKFIVRVDQRSLWYLLEQRMVATDHQKWLNKLLGYDFDIQYKIGAKNRVVNALSRVPSELSLAALSATNVLDLADIRTQVLADPFLTTVYQQIEADPLSRLVFTIYDEHLFYRG